MPPKRKKKVVKKFYADRDKVKKYTQELLEKLNPSCISGLEEEINNLINTCELENMDSYELAISIYKQVEVLIDETKKRTEFYDELNKHNDIVLEQKVIAQYVQKYVDSKKDPDKIIMNKLFKDLLNCNEHALELGIIQQKKTEFYNEINKYNDIVLDQGIIDEYALEYSEKLKFDGTPYELNDILRQVIQHNNDEFATHYERYRSFVWSWCC